MSAIACFFQVAAALGFGALILAALGLARQLGHTERIAWSFALGTGVIGWAVFWLGIVDALQAIPLALTLGAGLPGLWLLWTGKDSPPSVSPPNRWTGILACAMAITAMTALAIALAPPTDGDSLAYHFTLPRQFLAVGHLFPVPRAVDGAVPLLIQMTYIPPLALGGERAMTLWTMISSWGGFFLLYTLCRHWMAREWAMACTLVFATVPAVVYGAGSGQVEVRMAMLVLLAAAAVGRARTSSMNWAVIAGLAAGFLMGSKYTGLFPAFACGLVVMTGRRPLISSLVFASTAVIAGGQWYVWNAAHMGDPLFPMLSRILGFPQPAFWDAAVDTAYRLDWIVSEKVQTPTLSGFLAYPFEATFGFGQVLDAGRTGLGPILVLLAPFAIAAAWRDRWLPSKGLWVFGGIAFLTYTLWYFIPSSTRVRHLLPILPLLMIVLTACAHRAAPRIAAIAMALTLLLQLAGTALFSATFVRRVVAHESDAVFLTRTVRNYRLAEWIDQELPDAGLVMHTERQLEYFLTVPHLFFHKATVGPVHVATGMDATSYAARLHALGVTHLVVPEGNSDNPLSAMIFQMMQEGFITPLKRFHGTALGSRTLPDASAESVTFIAYQLETPH